MTCDKAVQIHTYYDGELDAATARQVEAHVAACPACAETLGELRGLSALLGGAELPPMRPMAVARFHGAWSEAEDRVLVRITGWLTAAAAAVLIGALTWWPAASATQQPRPGMWETIAVAPPLETHGESNTELVQVAQWMADDLSLGGDRQ
jgi:anti-sigma factor RsiW